DGRLTEALDTLAQAFVVGHKEHAVLDHRSSSRKTKLVAAERGTISTEPAVGLDLVVAQELVNRAVELVGSRLGGHDDLRGGLAVLGRVDAGLNLELLDRVDRRTNDEGVEVRIGVLHAVQRV